MDLSDHSENKEKQLFKVFKPFEEEYIPSPGDITCFLAGKMVNTPDWQQQVIDELKQFNDTEKLVIFNPRKFNKRPPPSILGDYIRWEFNFLEMADILAVYLPKGESPSSIYELARNVYRISRDHPEEVSSRIIISIEPGFEFKLDVNLQIVLALENLMDNPDDVIDNNPNPKRHAERIYRSYKELLKKNKSEKK